MLNLKSITKSYYTDTGITHMALNDLTISLPKAGLVFITGKSGSGKTTLLNLIGALDKADDGNIEFGNLNLSLMSNKELDDYRNTMIGFIFQKNHFIEDLSVLKNVELAQKLNGCEDLSLIEKYALVLEINHLLDTKVNSLSGGERQRVGILRALAKNPKIILADEPSGFLDIENTEKLFSLLKDVSSEKLVIVSTHDVEFAKKYAFHLINLGEGKIIRHLKVKKGPFEEKVEFISNNIIKVPIGKSLGEEELNAINYYLEKSTPDCFIAITGSKNMVKSLDPSQQGFNDSDREFFSFVRSFEKADSSEEVILRKSKITFRTYLHLARYNFRHKKTSLLLTIILAAFSLVLFFLSFDLTSYNRAKAFQYDLSTISENYVPVKTTGYQMANSYELKYGVELIKSYRHYQEYASEENFKADYTFNNISGYTEVKNAKELGLKLKYGGFDLKNDSEIIISEFLASDLAKQRNISQDKLINQTVRFVTFDLKIIGIYACNTASYNDLIPVSYSSSNHLISMISLYYGRLIVKEGFHKKIIMETVAYSNFNIFQMRLNDYIFTAKNYKDIKKILYEEENEKTMKDIYISEETFYGLFGEEFKETDLARAKELIKAFNENNYIEYINNFEFITDIIQHIETDFKIKGIIQNDDLYNNRKIYFSSEYFQYFSENTPANLDVVLFPKHFLQKKSAEKFESLYENNMRLLSQGGSGRSAGETPSFYDYAFYLQSKYVKFLYFFAALFIILHIFISSSYVSSSINYSKPHIGLLKSLGARRKDILLIYFLEVLIMAIFVLLIAFLSYFLTGLIINNNLSNSNNLRVKIFVFNLDTLLKGFMLVLIVGLVSFIKPILKIMNMTIREAMK